MKVGDKFTTFESFTSEFEKYKQESLTEYWIRDNRTLNAARKRVPEKVAKANKNLKYYYIKYCCIHGGQDVKIKDKRSNRKTRSFKQNCKAYIYLSLSDNCKFLEIKSLNDKHDHPLNSERTFKHLPQRRKLSEEKLMETRNLLSLRANKKLIISNLMKSTGKIILLKDISNLMRRNHTDADATLEQCVKILQGDYGCEVDLLTDDDRNFRGLFFQDSLMKRSYANFPEILFVDGTYKLLDIRTPVYLFVVEDSCGGSEIVGVGLLTAEDFDSVDWLIKTFKERNSNSDQLRLIMTDKDENERKALKKNFPNAKLLLCFFHTQQAFKREITSKKLGITPSEEILSKEIIQKIGYAKTPEEYSKLYIQMTETLPLQVQNYYNDNWHCIKEQWVLGFTYQCGNFLNSTNNRVESLNSKIKSIVKKYSTLKDFINSIFVELTIQRNERDHKASKMIHKVPIIPKHKSKAYVEYSFLLTNFAYELLECQLNETLNISKNLQILSDGTFIYNHSERSIKCDNFSCECLFFNSMQLPCRHIFAARNTTGESLYDKSLCNKRWHKEYFLQVHRLFREDESLQQDITDTVDIKSVANKRKLSSHEKFKRSLIVTKQIATICSEQSNEKFKQKLCQLQTLLTAWQNNAEVIITTDASVPSTSAHEISESDNLSTYDRESKCSDDEEISLPAIEGEKHNRNESLLKASENSKDTITDAAITLDDGLSPTLGHEIDDNDEDVSKSDSNAKKQNSTIEGENDHRESEVFDSHLDMQKETSYLTIKDIKMPPPMRKRGRPKGLENTVIGLPKKKKTQKKVPFLKLHHAEKEKIMLSWIIKDHNTIPKVVMGKLLEKNELNENVTYKLRDSNVNIFYIKKYLSKAAWEELHHIVESKKSNIFCFACAKDVHLNSNAVIKCIGCLSYFHLNCAGLQKKPKNKWFCRFC